MGKEILTIKQRDFLDLYLIIQKTGWKFDKLLKDARNKFDWHIDPLQLGANLMKAMDISDYPRMIKPIADKKWQDFFLKEAEGFRERIFK